MASKKDNKGKATNWVKNFGKSVQFSAVTLRSGLLFLVDILLYLIYFVFYFRQASLETLDTLA